MIRFLQILGIIICNIFLIGFGICGLCGVGSFLGSSHGSYSDAALEFGLIGIGISVVSGLLIRLLYRRLKSRNLLAAPEASHDDTPQ